MTRIVLVIALLAGVAHADSINAVLGNASGPANVDEQTRIATHLRYVLELLRARDNTGARAIALEALDHYIRAGSFPRRTDDTYSGRRPRFIDDRGVHCAVGFLVAQTDPELARAIDAEYEYAYVHEMRSPALVAWASAHGFTVDELAMVQPAYGSPPNEQDTKRDIEESKERWMLQCAANGPTTDVTLYVVGDKRGKATASAKDPNAFTRCIAELASTVESGGGAYRGSPEVYSFEIVLKLPTPQELLDRRVQRMELGDQCRAFPGPIPRTASVAVSITEEGLAASVKTKPENADVEACIVADMKNRFRDFANVRSRIAAQREVRFAPIFKSSTVTTYVKSLGSGAATNCYRDDAKPERITITTTANVGDDAFTFAFDTEDRALADCMKNHLDKTLRDTLGAYYARAGKPDRILRIDAKIESRVTIEVESREARDRRLEEHRKRPQKPRPRPRPDDNY